MKKEKIKEICEMAKIYDKNLKGKNLMFIFENKLNKKLDYIETQFLANNFMHLTGISIKKIKSSTEFYRLCLNNKLSYKQVMEKQNGTTKLKLEVLPQMLNIGKNARMVADYSNSKVNLYTEKLIGNIRCSIGFINVKGYYLPNTIIKEDIRQISQKETISRVIAILEKTTNQKEYSNITYICDNIDICSIVSKINIKNKISNVLIS